MLFEHLRQRRQRGNQRGHFLGARPAHTTFNFGDSPQRAADSQTERRLRFACRPARGGEELPEVHAGLIPGRIRPARRREVKKAF